MKKNLVRPHHRGDLVVQTVLGPGGEQRDSPRDHAPKDPKRSQDGQHHDNRPHPVLQRVAVNDAVEKLH